MTGVRLDIRPGTRWVPGRGVLVADRAPRVVQVAINEHVVRRTPVRSRATVANVNVMTNQSSRTASVAAPAPR
jgi:hypothetical protein